MSSRAIAHAEDDLRARERDNLKERLDIATAALRLICAESQDGTTHMTAKRALAKLAE